jgi:hypothetical protein
VDVSLACMSHNARYLCYYRTASGARIAIAITDLALSDHRPKMVGIAPCGVAML